MEIIINLNNLTVNSNEGTYLGTLGDFKEKEKK